MPRVHAINDDGTSWKTAIDFTEGGTTEGVPVQRALKLLKKMNLTSVHHNTARRSRAADCM